MDATTNDFEFKFCRMLRFHTVRSRKDVNDLYLTFHKTEHIELKLRMIWSHVLNYVFLYADIRN